MKTQRRSVTTISRAAADLAIALSAQHISCAARTAVGRDLQQRSALPAQFATPSICAAKTAVARFHHPAVERDSATETLRIGVHHSRVLFCPIVLFDRGAEQLRRRTARSVERILAELRAAAMLMSSTVKVRVASCHSWALSPTHVVWNAPASRVARHEHHASLTRALPRVA